MHLEKSKNISVGIENNSGDIKRFVYSEVDRLISKRLLLDGRVSQKDKRKIVRTLTNGAQGMFRWVELSLETLKRIKFLPDFQQALGQLPSDLAGLYDIIHAQIDQTETYGRDLATQTLKWLLCSQRLLTAEELIAAVYKVDKNVFSDSDEDSERFEQDAPSTSPENDILRLCRNLVVFDSEQRLFRFSHQSVREYLLKQPQYTAVEQHNLAAERCLDIYLTEYLETPINPRMEQRNNILRRYAEVHWPVHFKHVEGSQSAQLKKSVSRFTGAMQGKSIPYKQWIKGLRSSYQDKGIGLDPSSPICSRIDFVATRRDPLLAVASAFGISYFLQVHESLGNRSQPYLAFAARQGHDQVVQLLLDKGAGLKPSGNPDAIEMNVLEEACINGFDSIVRLLLDNGADINARGGIYGTALQGASSEGHYQIVQTLLDRGVDVHARGGIYGTALQGASSEGHYQIVQTLLDRGVDVHARGGKFGTALKAASACGHKQIVQLLLDRGADVNAQSGGKYGTALRAASTRGYEQIVQMLLDRGADVNAQSNGKYGPALRASSARNYKWLVQMLKDREVDVMVHSRWEYGTALEAASSYGHHQTVQLLLDRGADVNAQSDGSLGTALEAAFLYGHEQIVQLLLARGAKSINEVLPSEEGTFRPWISGTGR